MKEEAKAAGKGPPTPFFVQVSTLWGWSLSPWLHGACTPHPDCLPSRDLDQGFSGLRVAQECTGLFPISEGRTRGRFL